MFHGSLSFYMCSLTGDGFIEIPGSKRQMAAAMSVPGLTKRCIESAKIPLIPYGRPTMLYRRRPHPLRIAIPTSNMINHEGFDSIYLGDFFGLRLLKIYDEEGLSIHSGFRLFIRSLGSTNTFIVDTTYTKQLH
ncbi:hypothetical protein G7K_2033-t1 [Saitoella complicata NRRL Y-17804]|uniref:Uncharacterized protein n=1 Tax=Saitoella complicata (strain BCRC 22490 / CBS 7301 / JCM 7358 / NBRC 10748 / NRRL Y-17804) TaxID=698492 RepID=A0A0E9NDM7_SAICN|nr:hypothetical protein G7K_2033-t1 [Saitoella complicata NRRL Y-17804]